MRSSAVHVIRIHSAWQRTELKPDLTAANSLRLSLPDNNALASDTHTILYVRKFNSPTGLHPANRIEFDCDLLRVASAVVLNGLQLTTPLGEPIIDITDQLQRFNEIMIRLPVSAIDSARTASARLLITGL